MSRSLSRALPAPRSLPGEDHHRHGRAGQQDQRAGSYLPVSTCTLFSTDCHKRGRGVASIGLGARTKGSARVPVRSCGSFLS